MARWYQTVHPRSRIAARSGITRRMGCLYTVLWSVKQKGGLVIVMELVILGSGAGGGVPAFYCGCDACREAAAERRCRRTRCAVAVLGQEITLVDAPPELRIQLIREGIQGVDRLLMTHWHYDHSGGLADLEFYVRVRRGEAIPAYMTAETQDWLGAAFDTMGDCLYTQTVAAGDRVETGDVCFTALDAAHAPGTVGWLMESRSGKRTAYIPDTGPLPAATRALLAGVDTLILGASFWGRNCMPDTHLSVDEAVRIALDLKAKQTYLTHLSMHHDTPVTCRELETYLGSVGREFHLAYDGTAVEL